jgi:16S rRNA (uracil1498-N3)-methyltransferase
MRRFYAPIENHPDQRFALDAEQSRHVQKVLRLQPDDEIQIFDGHGNEFVCVIEEFKGKAVFVRVVKQVEPAAAESSLNLTLAVALIKGDKFDLVIQKAVELGITLLVPITTIRSEVKIRNSEK